MRTRTLLIAGMLLVTLIATTFAAGQTSEAATSDKGRLEEIGFHETGFPVVDQTVTIQVMAMRDAQKAPYAEMTLLNELQEMMNVKFIYDEIPQAQIQEKTNLMFASRDFPDVTWNAAVGDTQLWEAAQGGDVWPLNDLVEKYSPNWKRAWEERPVTKKGNTMPDGQVYSFPYYREILNDYGIRDITAVNVDWLKKVGKEIPTNTEEFYQVLKAFRQGIDSGVLPENGIPWLLRYHAWANGGEFEIYNTFGLWMKGQGSGADRYCSVDNGKVLFGASDPKLKDAVKFMHKLYSEDLMDESMFTDGSPEHRAKSRSVPPIVGFRAEYFNHNPEFFQPQPPIAGPDGTRRFRSQPIRMEKNKYVVYKNFEYPEVAVRFMDIFADDDWSIKLSYGGPMIEDAGNGMKRVVGAGTDWSQHGPHNMIASYISKRASDKVIWTGQQGEREAAVRDVFQPYLWPQDRHYAYITYTAEETEELSIIGVEIADYIETQIADWIVNGGVDAGWDNYLAELDRLNLDKAMEIYQTAYDRFWK